MFELRRIKVGNTEMVLSARGDHWDSQSASKSRLEIDTVSMTRKVSDNERRKPNIAHDLVHYPIVVLLQVGT